MRKALIVIDVQKGFINQLTNKIPFKIKNFIKKNKKNYDLIVFTKYFNHKNSNFVKNLNYKGFMREEETAIVEELKGFVNKQNLFIKDTYGSFIDNRLLNFFRKNKIQQVELVGFDTENCVLTFARDAFDRGLAVVVFKNLCASSNSLKLHQAAIEIIKNNIGKIK